MSSAIETPNLERTRYLLTQFDHLGRAGDLDEAIQHCLTGQELPRDDSYGELTLKWTILYAFGLVLRFEQESDEDIIDKAQQCLEEAIVAGICDSSLLVYALYVQGRMFEARHNSSFSTETTHLSGAIRCYRRAIALREEDPLAAVDRNEELPLHLVLVLVHGAYSGAESCDLIEAVERARAIADANSDNILLKPLIQFCLLMGLRARWFSGGQAREDWDEGVGPLLERVEDPQGHRLRHRFLMELGVTLMYRYDSVGGSIECLHEAIANLEEAYKIVYPLHSSQSRWLDAARQRLGTCYIIRFQAEGKLRDLDLALEVYRPCLSMRSTNVTLALCHLYQERGRLADLDEAIISGREAVCDCPDDPTQAYPLGNLGWALSLRFAHARQLDDFSQARQFLHNSAEACVRLGKAWGLLRADRLRRLADLHTTRHKVGKLQTDLDMAVEYLRETLAVVPSDSIELPSYLSELGRSLSNRFEFSASFSDLNESIQFQQHALRLAPDTYGERSLLLGRYAHVLRLRFQTTRDDEDFARAIRLLDLAIPPARASDHPKLTVHLHERAACYASRYSYFNDPGDLDSSLSHYLVAGCAQQGYIRDRFNAAVEGARFAQTCHRFSQATELYSAAIALLPRIAWLGDSAETRQQQLAVIAPNVACDAAACALMCGLPERAVELLDEGRSVMWRSILSLRNDNRRLQGAAPELARSLLEVAESLEHDDAGGSQITEKHAEERAQRRRRLAEQWDVLVERVRKLEGFSTFLKPHPYASLQRAASDGPIVLLNVSELRSDALVISNSEPIQSIPLPGLDLGTVKRLAYVLTQSLRVAKDTRGSNFLDQVLTNVLRALWKGGMASVAGALYQLQEAERRANGLFRVWWIPTGLLNLLPIHCAGPFDGDLPGLSDLVISSYTTTASALLTARASRSTPSSLRMLAISQPSTPGHSTLPSASMEIAVLKATTFRGSIDLLDGPDATVKRVSSAVVDHNWMHICSHGSSNPERPLDSAFYLHDGPLSLAHILQLRLPDADFAFLSACHSARHTEVLPDEALTLAAGLQVANFRSIVATLWAMADCDGPVLSKHFYHYLTAESRAPDAKNAAEALHNSIACLRKAGTPLHRWAAFVHIGV